MDPADNLDLARFLSARPKGAPEEASIRGSCGRAYYAAFGVARDALLAAKLFKSTGASADHAAIISLLKKSANPGIQISGGLLDQLRNTRNSSDYDVGLVPLRAGQVPFVPLVSQMAVVLGQQITDEIENLKPTKPKLEIP